MLKLKKRNGIEIFIENDDLMFQVVILYLFFWDYLIPIWRIQGIVIILILLPWCFWKQMSRTHTGEECLLCNKPCTFCVLGFQTKDSIKTHVEKVHGLTKLNLKEEKSENVVCIWWNVIEFPQKITITMLTKLQSKINFMLKPLINLSLNKSLKTQEEDVEHRIIDRNSDLKS